MIRTIYILWLRQLKRYIRSRSRMIGSLGQPLLFLLALGYGFGPVFLKETLVAPVSRLNIMIGRTLGGATVATLQGIIVFFLAIAAGFRPTSLTFLPVAFLIMALTALLFTAMGTAIASLLEDMQGFQMVMNFLAASLNPLTYCVDGLRGALAGQMHFGFGIDLGVLTGVTVLFLVVGSYLFSKIEI